MSDEQARTMRAAVLESPGGEMVMRRVQIAEPVGAEVLVRIRASGICHSDITAASHLTAPELPVILGHEVAGEVIAVGPEVRAIAVGDLVVACEIRHCGVCDDCLRGRPFQCVRPDATERAVGHGPRVGTPALPITQFSHVGGFAELTLVHENSLVVVPPDTPAEIAAVLGCGVVTGAGAAAHTAGVRVGDTVAVIGCGGVGLSVIAGAALAGARTIIAIDLREEKLALARAFGATHTLNGSTNEVTPRVHHLTGGIGVMHAFECVGSVPTVRQALSLTRPVGTTYLIGIHHPEVTLDVNLFHDLLMAKRSLRSVYMGSSTFRVDIPMYLDFWKQGRFPLDLLVGRRIALHEVNEACARIGTDGVARTVITDFSEKATDNAV